MKKNVFTSTSAAIVLAITFSCGKDYKAGSTVKSFVRDNFDERVFTNPYEPVDLERVMTARKKYFTTSAEKQNAKAAREKKQEAAE